MELNQNNLHSILISASCCISKKAEEALKKVKIGDIDCYDKLLNEIILLNSYYEAIQSHIASCNFKYKVDGFTDSIASTNIIAIRIYEGNNIVYENFILNIFNPFTTISDFLKTIDILVDLDIPRLYIDGECQYQNLRIHIYKPLLKLPSFEVDLDTVVLTYIDEKLEVLEEGCCSSTCLTTEQINDIYNKLLSLCEICKNCN